MTHGRRIRVGFGPETTANSFRQSGVKVAGVLSSDPAFECGFFREPFALPELSNYDVLVFIKISPPYDVLKRLKDMGKVLLLDYQDMFLFPSVYEKDPVRKALKKLYYYRLEAAEKMRYSLFDRCLVASPASEAMVREAGMEPFFLQRQIYNDRSRSMPRRHTDRTKGLTIYWTGVALNLDENGPVEPVLKALCCRHSSKVVYHTQGASSGDGAIEYRHWTLENWEDELAQADIAFRWWRDSNNQYHKDSNKVISYMAAALPVVCRPTLSDKRVIDDGRTGFFASTPEAFGGLVERLILDPALRQAVGEAAFRDAWARYSLESHVGCLKGLINGLTGGTLGREAV